MTDWTTQLNQLKIKEFPELFAGLSVPLPSSVKRHLSRQLCGTGLAAQAGRARPGHQRSGRLVGKNLPGGRCGGQPGAESRKTRRTLPHAPGLCVHPALDGKPTLALIYAQDNPFPWPYIVDELRQLDAEAYLGMTYVNWGVLRKLAFPFLIESKE